METYQNCDHNHNNCNNPTTNYNTNIFIQPDSDSKEIIIWKEKLASILENVPAEVDTLKPLIQLLVAAISPSKIFLLQHKDTINAPSGRHIDLLMVIASKCALPFTELEPILEIAYLKDQRVCCSLHSEGNLLENLRLGHIFYSLNCIPENLIYDDKAIELRATTPQVIQEIKSISKEKFTRIFDKALHFYECALSLHQNHSSQIIAFMLHQSIELTCRGMLQCLNGYDKKTHDIRSLKKYLRRCAPQMNAIFPDGKEEEKHLLDVLEASYLDPRYEHNYSISGNDLDVLIEKTRQLHISAKEIVEATLNGN